MDPGQQKGRSPPFADLTNVSRTGRETKEIKRRERARFASLSAEQRNKRNKRKRESYRKKEMTIYKENTVPRETHQQDPSERNIDEILCTPGVGSKQRLIEAHDIGEQDIQGLFTPGSLDNSAEFYATQIVHRNHGLGGAHDIHGQDITGLSTPGSLNAPGAEEEPGFRHKTPELVGTPIVERDEDLISETHEFIGQDIEGLFTPASLYTVNIEEEPMMVDYGVSGTGACDSRVSDEPQIIDPKERWRERDRARRASMYAEERALINQRRRQSYHAKKLQKTEETIEREKIRNRLPARKEGKREYKRRMKEYKANNLQPDSIAMANPEFVPKIIFSTPIESRKSASEWVIPKLSGTPVYIQPLVEQSHDVQDMDCEDGRSPVRRRVPAGERISLRN
ncbi:hypothetical protein C2845_PM01G11120 [Panicum miliaceum]|uniref:Uncharacterized protein n=1 Tax=Panicum miliaceum TaxID=4540 RepID=A0A3L6TLN3_PANMI|nr:hypothetical protein C2845_PM01G11120 [Panicum miliaceum]